MEALYALLAIVLLALPIILFAMLGTMNERIKRIEKNVNRLAEAEAKRGAERIRESAPNTPPAPSSAPPAPPAPPVPQSTPPAPSSIPLPPIPPPPSAAVRPKEEAPMVGPIQRESRFAARETQKKRTSAEWEAVIGTTWLNRIGAVAVLVSSLFFLKYAFDNDLINEWGRVIIGLVAGLAMIAGGDFARRKKLEIFSQGLVGAGLPILYLTIYAAFNFYSLVPQFVAFLAMAAVGALALFMSIRHHSAFIAGLGAVGGLLTPALLSTGELNTTGLFAYIAILDVALLAIALNNRKWFFLDILVVVGTWAWWFLWHDQVDMMVMDGVPYDQFRVAGIFFIWLFTAGFIAYDFLLLSREREGSTSADLLNLERIVAVVNIIASWLFIHTTTDAREAWQEDVTGAVFAGLCMTFGIMAQRKGWTKGAWLPRYIAAIALVWWVPMLWHDPSIYRIWWAVAGVGLVMFFRTCDSRLPVWMSYSIFILGMINVLFENSYYSFLDGGVPVFNLGAGPILLLLLGGAFAAPHVLRDETKPFLQVALKAGRVLFVLGAIATIHADVVSYGEAMGELASRYAGMSELIWKGYLASSAATCLTGLLGIGVLFWANRAKDTALHAGGLVVLGSAALLWVGDLVWTLPDDHYNVVFNLRALVGLIFIGYWVAAYRWSALRGQEWRPTVWVHFCGWVTSILVFFLVSIEAYAPFDQRGEINESQLALSTVWILYGAALMWMGFARRSRSLRIGAMVLMAFTILKVFLYDLSYLEQPYRIISFIVLGVILLIASFVYTRFKDVILETESGEQRAESEVTDETDDTSSADTMEDGNEESV